MQLKQDASNIEGHSVDIRKEASASQEKSRQQQLNIKEPRIEGNMGEPGSAEPLVNALSSPNAAQ